MIAKVAPVKRRNWLELPDFKLPRTFGIRLADYPEPKLAWKMKCLCRLSAWFLSTIFSVLVPAGSAQAAVVCTINVNTLDSGYYDVYGEHDSQDKVGLNGFDFQYQARGPYRSFMAFQIPSFPGTLLSATIEGYGYSIGSIGEESLFFHEVTNRADVVRLPWFSATNIYSDLADGPLLGSASVSPAFQPLSVSLSNGLAAVAAARGQDFVVGGHNMAGPGGQGLLQFPYASWAPVTLRLQVSVPPEPFIYSQLSPTALFSNDTVIIVGACGAEPLTYNWYVNGSNTASFVDYPQLYLGGLSGSNVPVYVVVTNSFGSATSSVTIVRRSPARLAWPNTNIAIRTEQTLYTSIQANSMFGFYPGLRWFKDGIEFSNPNFSSLNIPNAQPSNSGNYTVVASNAVGVVTSAVMHLEVQDVAPRFWEQPRSITNALGSWAYVNATAIAGPRAKIYWYHNGVLVPPTTNNMDGNLSFAALTFADAGSYYAVASNHVGRATSQVAYVEVILDPPVFTTQPESRVTYAGQFHYFILNADGSPFPDLQWYFNNQPIPGERYLQLVLGNVTSSNAGNYFCVASNASGVATSDVATLTVLAVPPVIGGPVDGTAPAGHFYTVSAFISNPPVCLRWYVDGTLAGGSDFCTGPASGPYYVSRTFLMGPSNYTSQIFVVASNEYGISTGRVASITVNTAPPIFSLTPSNMTVLEGSSVYIPAFANGAPPPRLFLLRDGQDVGAFLNGSLYLLNISPAQSGEYVVAASNAVGMVTSPPFRISVQRLGPLDRWTRRHPSPQGNDLHGLTFGQGRWVACGDVGTLITSTNATNWSVFSADVPAELEGLTYGNGMFVAVGSYGAEAIVVTSTNAETWATQHLPDIGQLRGITFAEGRFLAVGSEPLTGTQRAYVSSNATSWTTLEPLPNTSGFDAVASGNGRWVIAIDNSTASFSSDLVTWTNVSTLVSDPEGATFINGRFFIVGNNGRIATSLNGQNWTPVTNGVTSRRLYGASFNAGLYVAVGARGTIISSATATDLSWALEVSPTTDRLEDILFASDLFVAVGENGTILTSYDGHAWTEQTRGVAEDLDDIAVSGDLAIAVGKSGTILTSTDGRAWELAPLPSPLENAPPDWHGVGVGDGKIVVVGETTNILVSTDNGASWHVHGYVASASYLKSVIYAQGLWVAAGIGGVIMTSTNATNWTQQFSPVPYDLNDVTYGNGQFVVVGDKFPSPDATILVSTEGSFWQNLSYSLGKNARAITFAKNRFLIGANDGRFLTSTNPSSGLWTFQFAAYSYDGANLRGVTERSNIWIAVGNNGIIMTAYTSNTNTIGPWKGRLSRTVENLHGVQYFKGSFLAVGNRGIILQSGPLESRLGIERTGTGVRLVFSSPYEGVFKLEESTDFSWQDGGSINNIFGTVEQGVPASGAKKFYRVVEP
jgi:hypothetical protein